MEFVDLARAVSARGDVLLRERRDPVDGSPPVLELRVNGVFVMDSRETDSEQRLASAALARVAEPRRVLVGGLGLGFTVRAVLADPRVRRVDVAEIEEALVAWTRDGTVPHGPALLEDERLHVVAADVRAAVAGARPASYDLVLLDVDNGPGFLVHDANAEVYRAGFLRAVRDVLRPGGAVAVWSASEAPALAGAMEAVFGACTPVPVPVRLQDRDERYWCYLSPH